MTPRAFLARHSEEAKRKRTECNQSENEYGNDSTRVSSSGQDTASASASVSLSAHQEKLLAGFGVSSSGHLQSRLALIEQDIKRRQDRLPACSLANKEAAVSLLSPTLVYPQPPSNFQSHKKESFVMAGFDPSKYGAPSKKQRVEISGNDKDCSIKQDPVSDVSHNALDRLTQGTKISEAAKPSEVMALKPKSTNKITIPGFDGSKYGAPQSRLNRNLAPDETKVNTDIEVCEKTVQTSDTAHLSSNPQKQVSPSFAPAPHYSKKPVMHAGVTNLPKHATDKNDGFSNKQQPVLSNNKTTPTQRLPVSSSIPSRRIVAPIPPPPGKAISKEERLKQVQQEALHQIGFRNRHKGDAPETTSVRDLRIAREAASSEPLSAFTSSVAPIVNHAPTNVVSTQATSQAVRPQKDSSTLKTFLAMHPALLGQSKEDRLKEAQQESLRAIGMKNRGDGRDSETTSLADLNLARTPKKKRDDLASAAALSSVALPHRLPMASPREDLAKTATMELNTEKIQSNIAASGISNVSYKKTRNPNWCTNEELRPEPNLETNSNAYGSELPSNASVASSDSVRPMQLHGRLFHGSLATGTDEITALVDWDGNLQPPPVDWSDRPRFNNNSPAFKNGFNNWVATAASECFQTIDRTPMFRSIPYHQVSNVEWHADGLAMTRREFTLNAHNISRYGYNKDPADVAKYAEKVTPQDYEDWAKLDMREADNVKFKDETTEHLVKNWLAHFEKSKQIIPLAGISGHRPIRASQALKIEEKPNEPSLNIYLRPAVKGDIEQMTDLYNWWVENSVRCAEVRPIAPSDMEFRFENTKAHRLPFVVAILKAKKDVHRNFYGVKAEQVVGFASAVSITAVDYVEHISAEVDVYVHQKYLRQGVGKCLMDRMMCATDRGHMRRGGYKFHCDPSEAHWYEVGGARDIHKIMFVARQYSRVKKDRPEELQVTTWIKKWLKEWDFEHEATLKQAGAKNGRFLDLNYFTKFSKWLPEDGRVPDPEPKDHQRP